MATVKEDPKSPWPAYFMIATGACLAAAVLLDKGLSGLGVVKLLVGIGIVASGIWRLATRKRSA